MATLKEYRIPMVGIQHGGGYNLVDKKMHPIDAGRVWQHQCDGRFICSNISNMTKCYDLQKLSNYFKLNLLMEEVKPKERRNKHENRN